MPLQIAPVRQANPQAAGHIAEVVEGSCLIRLALQNPVVIRCCLIPKGQSFFSGAAIEMGVNRLGLQANRFALISNGTSGSPRAKRCRGCSKRRYLPVRAQSPHPKG